MGVMCQILLQRPPEGYWKPSSSVTGVIKYAIDEPTEFSGITISLIGKGNCHWTERKAGKVGTHRHSQMNGEVHHYRGNEDFFNIKTNVLNKNEGEIVIIKPGSYEFEFSFIFPNDLPPTYKDVHSKISYGVVAKFKRPGLFQFNKRFYVETVLGGSFQPVLPQEPIMYGLDKSLFTLFSSRKSVINLKAEIEKSFLRAGDSAKLSFVVTNHSKVVIPSIQIELLSVTTYTSTSGRQKRVFYTVSNSKHNTASIPDSSKSNLNALVRIPNDIFSVQHSKIISKEWMLRVIIKLPMPHINASVDIPIVVARVDTSVNEVTKAVDDGVKPSKSDDAPPSYWEVMTEGDEKLFAL